MTGKIITIKPGGRVALRTKSDKSPRLTPRIGVHVSVAGGLEVAFENGRNAACDCLQIFVKNQRQWRARPLSDDQVRRFRAAWAPSGITPVLAHGSYLLNLAAPSQAIRQLSIEAMIDELTRCEAIGVAGLVFHPGAHCDGQVRDPYELQIRNSKFEIRKRPRHSRDRQEAGPLPGKNRPRPDRGRKCTEFGGHMLAGIERIARGIDEVHLRCAGFKTKLLLECTAGQGSAIGWQFEQLAAILHRVRDSDRLGVCLDTCHLFAAGYDFRKPDGYAEMIDRLDRTVGLAKVMCVHCNDSKRELGSRVDRHDHIGKGLIGKSGFANFLNDSRFREVPFILETPKEKDAKGRDMDRVNVQQLRRLLRRNADTISRA